MRPKKAVRWECADGELHDEAPERKEGFICGECEEFYEDRDEALDCCKF